MDDTKRIYADWADTYENDLTTMAYATPDRIAAALALQGIDVSAPVLDFGCGTGLSGAALHKHGFTTIDGTDITPEMIAHAQAKTTDAGPLYRKLWLGSAEGIAIDRGTYSAIVATGVISLGAAPADLLSVLLHKLDAGGVLAFSFNDPTLEAPSYTGALDKILSDATATQLFREHGPHLNAKVTGSDVIVLRRT